MEENNRGNYETTKKYDCEKYNNEYKIRRGERGGRRIQQF